MKTGTVISYNDQKGYGFIGLGAGQKDLYVHASQLLNRSLELKPGDSVSFDVTQGQRGLMATQVQVLRRGAGRSSASLSGSAEEPRRYAQRCD